MRKKIDIIFLCIILLLRLEIQANKSSTPYKSIGVTFQSPLCFPLWGAGLYIKETGMKTKICTKCKIEKSVNEFYKNWNNKAVKYYYTSNCKKCMNEYSIEYRRTKAGKDYFRKYRKSKNFKESCKKYNQSDKGKSVQKKYQQSKKGKDYFKKYHQSKKYKNYQKKYMKKYQQTETYRNQQKEYSQSKKGKIIRKKYRETEAFRNSIKKYNQSKKGRIVINERQRERWKKDINFKIRMLLSNRINIALKNNSKNSGTMELLGCSIDKLKNYLENQFQVRMTWKNHNIYGWHIDHKKPCNLFDLTKESEQKKCFHYTNLQPLWAKDNWKKNDRYNPKSLLKS